MGESKAPITLLSCDNLPHNGNVLRRLVTQISEINYDGLTQYVRDDTRVKLDSMVDRITPADGGNGRTFGYVENKDRCQWPVIAEDFTMGLEDDFVAGHRVLSSSRTFISWTT